MLEELLKLVPETSSESAPLPGGALDGVSELTCGAGLFTVNVMTVEGRLPGLDTVTIGVPATAMALAGMLACNSVVLKNEVAIGIPLKLKTELAEKLLPDTVNGNAGPPAVALAGESVPTTGWTFGGETASATGLEVPPPLDPLSGLVTVIEAEPALAMSLAKIATLRAVAETKVVCRATPLKFTTELPTKLNPDTDSVKPGPPATTLEGLMDKIIGAALAEGAGGTKISACATVAPPATRTSPLESNFTVGLERM